jgi:hypothetical protein
VLSIAQHHRPGNCRVRPRAGRAAEGGREVRLRPRVLSDYANSLFDGARTEGYNPSIINQATGVRPTSAGSGPSVAEAVVTASALRNQSLEGSGWCAFVHMPDLFSFLRTCNSFPF